MNQGIYPLAAGMVNQFNRLDQISNNLANVNTNGFKEEGLTETTFNYYLERANSKGEAILPASEVTNNIPKIDTKYIDGGIGPIVQTGNNLDFALSKSDMFFKVEDNNGDIVLTRDGSFKILDGFLVDSNGNNVLNADNEPIVSEDDFGLSLGVIQSPYSNLEKVGNNNYKLKNDNEFEIIADSTSYIVQGAIEKSNVNSVTAMVSLIDAHRRFEQSQKAITSIDEINSKVIDKIGSDTK